MFLQENEDYDYLQEAENGHAQPQNNVIEEPILKPQPVQGTKFGWIKGVLVSLDGTAFPCKAFTYLPVSDADWSWYHIQTKTMYIMLELSPIMHCSSFGQLDNSGLDRRTQCNCNFL